MGDTRWHRGVLAALALVAVGTVTVAFAAPNSHAPGVATAAEVADHAVTETDLGTPIEGVVSPSAAYTVAPDGVPEGVFIANGEPARVSVVDLRTGERRFEQALPEVVASWGSETAPDGTVYLGSQRSGELYRYIPGTDEVQPIGRAVESETHHWGIDVAPDGRVYGGTYPGGKVFGYDPEADAFTDYGQLVPDVGYVRDVAASDHLVYAGTSPEAHLIELDPTTGDTREIELPPHHQDQDAVYNVSVSAGLVFARVQPAHAMLVYDPEANAWIDEIPDTEAFEVPEPGPDGITYLTTADGLVGYDVERRTWDPVDVPWSGTTRGAAWLPLEIDGFPGQSFVTAHFRGTLFTYNPGTGNERRLDGDVAGVPLEVSALGTGPAGDIYVGGYLSPPGMARVDVDTGASELLPGVSQVEGMGTSGDLLFLGVYPNGNVRAYDTSQTWDPPHNPPDQIPLGEQQDRPVAFASIEESVAAVGSVPVSGELGGALSFVDAEANSVRVHRDIVPDQSPVTLAARDGLLVGGTSISGGLGVDPVAVEGELFRWDLDAEEVVFRTVPVPGAAAVSALTFDDDNLVWGLAGGWLFVFDPASHEIVRAAELFPDAAVSTYWKGDGLRWRDGRLFGLTAGRVFEVDPQSLTATVLADDATHFAIDRHGSVYFARGTHVFRIEDESR